MAAKLDSTDPKWVMAGTQGTGEYRVIACNSAGRLGIRTLGGSVRIRIEPTGPSEAASLAELFPAPTWKQPEGSAGGKTYRFSQVVPMGTEGAKAVRAALKQLKKRGSLKRNIRLIFWRFIVQG